MSQLQAMRAVLKLMAGWPRDKPVEYLEQIAVVFTRYPAGIVDKCIHPLDGVAPAHPDYLPSVPAIVKWCEAELAYCRMLCPVPPARLAPILPASAEDKAKVQAKL